jgi:WD40-like Beta Propeller Repeat
VAFVSTRSEAPGIYQKLASGEAQEQLLLPSNEHDRLPMPSDWGANGILFEKDSDLWIRPLSGNPMPYAVIREPGRQIDGKFSPDARWIAYASRETGRWEVRVQSSSNPGVKFRISEIGGSLPRWRSDGKELFYLSADGNLMAVPIYDSVKLRRGTPTPLFQTKLNELRPGLQRYNVLPGGQRFLVATADESSEPASLVVVKNWAAELEQ